MALVHAIREQGTQEVWGSRPRKRTKFWAIPLAAPLLAFSSPLMKQVDLEIPALTKPGFPMVNHELRQEFPTVEAVVRFCLLPRCSVSNKG